jgi:hypothetical protein
MLYCSDQLKTFLTGRELQLTVTILTVTILTVTMLTVTILTPIVTHFVPNAVPSTVRPHIIITIWTLVWVSELRHS